MDGKVQITASIVLYKENGDTLQKTIDSFLNTQLTKKLYLIDNSPNDFLKKYADHPDVNYSFSTANIGFGKAHNTVLENSSNSSEYHLFLNPDVAFKPNVIPNLMEQLSKDQNVSMISPKVLYPDGELQYTCRKYPRFLDLIIRRLGIFKKRVYNKEYRDQDLTKTLYPDFIHGCFLLFKTQDLIDIKGFDERYFLYMEDADICRKIDAAGKKKMYYPQEEIVHIHRKGSNKSIRLFFRHLISAIKYFNKWGY
ncbi:glycosyltransferase family 2 protein [Flavobacteriaceae bacterium S356]|uniref:Glycosyltransferase family 2 protein n=1 Tax=Asprobacillus argus TaxID=3076534 RepID=A0ABU3LBN9_9FLAO|nr:glycosyltransferase family 2 protein [Flavobacteriaceae bacterium S356]